MRGIKRLGLGLALCVSAGTASGQSPEGVPPAPAARIGKIVAKPVSPNPHGLNDGTTARGQQPYNPPIAYSGNGNVPQPVQQPAGGNMLGTPRPIGGPTITEQRESSPNTGAVQVPFGQPYPASSAPSQVYPGQPFVVGQPFPSGQPFPNGQGYTPVNTETPAPEAAAAVPGPTTGSYPVSGPVVMPSVLPNGGYPQPGLEDPLLGSYGSIFDPSATQPRRLELRAEYLLWWVRSFGVPPLLTTSSPQFEGVIGQGDTSIITPKRSFTDSLHGGGRFGGTYWLGDNSLWGADFNLFFLGANRNSYTATSNEFPLLARPFMNLNEMEQDSQIIGFPGLFSGYAQVDIETQVWGADVSARRKLLCGPCSNLDLLVGFRYLRLAEELSITEAAALNRGSTLQSIDGGPVRTFGIVTDNFRTVNEFYGPQVGFNYEIRRGRWSANWRTSVAFGTVFQVAEINGGQAFRLSDGSSGVAQGGLLALPNANIGRFSQTSFGVLPEVGLQLGYQLTQRARVTLGYNFMYLDSTLRPGDQIDTGLDVTRIPNFPLAQPPEALPLTRPVPQMRESAFFAQGISFGFQYQW